MLRKVKSTDASAITDIYNRYIAETTISFETECLTEKDMMERICDISEKYPYFVWEENGKPVGYCYAHPWKERAAYSRTLETTIYIDNTWQRRGIGHRLMKALIDECRIKGYHALIACVTGDNEASIKMHESLGFSKVSCFKEVGYKHGQILDVVDLELLL